MGRRRARRRDLRPADQAQRDPRRPRRRHLPAQLHRRVLGLQQHLHPRDQRLPRWTASSRATRASTGSSRSPPTTASTTASRRSARGDSGIYPGSGPEGHCQRYGIEIRNVNSHHNTIGYSGTAGNGVWAHDNKLPPQRHRHDDRLVRLRAPGHAAGLREVGEQPDLLQQRGLLQRRARRLLQEHADREARPDDRVPDLPGPGRHRHRHLRRQRRHRPQQLHLRQLARRRSSCSTCRPRSAASPTRASTRRSTTRSPATRWACGPTARRTPTATTSGGTSRARATAGAATPATAACVPSSNVVLGLPGVPRLAGPSAPGQPGQAASQATCATWDPMENPDPPGCDWFTRPAEPPDDSSARRRRPAVARPIPLRAGS